MNLQEQFYQAMTNSRLRRSRAASSGKEDARATEMINGLLVSKRTAKLEIIDLQEYAKSAAASVQGINKLKAIQEFFNSNGRI